MKRYFSGMRMLDDIENKKIPFAEKMLYLYVIFGPGFDLLNPSLLSSKDENTYVSSVIFIVSLFFYYIVSIRSNRIDKAIERYLCLTVPAIVTSYLIVIPLNFLLNNFLSGQFLIYFLMFYLPLFMPVSLYLWIRLSRVKDH